MAAKADVLIGGHVVAFGPLLITTGIEMVHTAFLCWQGKGEARSPISVLKLKCRLKALPFSPWFWFQEAVAMYYKQSREL